ncbi:MAG: PilW family protein [Cyanobacterium sp.]
MSAKTKAPNPCALLINLWKSNTIAGITTPELLTGLVIGGAVITATASGFINILRANQRVEEKSIRMAALNKALNYLQEDIKQAKFVTAEKGGNCNPTAVHSEYCLVLTFADNTKLRDGCSGEKPKIYYGYRDIRRGEQIWLKPGMLRKRIVCETGAGNWIAVADGLISVNEDNPVENKAPSEFCNREGVNLTSPSAVYGGNSQGKGGFRFCLDNDNPNNRLVRIFLYGHIINENPLHVNVVTFARAGEN